MLGVVLALVAVHAGPSQAASITVKAPSVKGAKGDEVKVPLTLSGDPGIGALQLELTYDAAVLQAVSATNGSLVSGALVEFKVPAPGRLRVALATTDKVGGNGQIVVARFKVLGKKGQKSPLTLENVRAWQGDLNRFDMKVTAQSGEFTVSAGSSFPWWLILVLVLLLILAYVLWRRSRKGSSPPTDGGSMAPPPPPSSAPPPPPVANMYVDSPQPLMDGAGQQVGTLQPGQWYRALRQEGEWIETTDEHGTTGWVQADNTRRS
jgi:hypothetical protein